MSLRRFISVLSVVTVATASVAFAGPNDKKAPAPAPAPAKEAEPAPATGSGTGSGEAVAPIEDAPPADIEGRDENPDAPKSTLDEVVAAPTPVVVKPAGYPIEETQHPITLPANLAEVSIAPHFVAKPFSESDALRARYGITKQIQLGLTYVYGGIYDDPTTLKKTYGFHVGKAAGFDITVLLQNWLAIKVGVPVYFDPVATSFTAGAPMKFVFGNKLAIGGLEDIVNIRISEFPPSLEFEQQNAVAAANKTTNTQQSRGKIRFSGFVEYQQDPKTAIIGRAGVETDLGGGGDNGPGTASGGGTRTFIRAGVQHSPKKNIDVGGGVGFEDLSDLGSFAVALTLAFRI
jgi:hypothetical protein